MSASPTSPSSRKRQPATAAAAAAASQPHPIAPASSSGTQNTLAASTSPAASKALPAAVPTPINTDAANKSAETIAKSPQSPSSGRKRKAAEMSTTPASNPSAGANRSDVAASIAMSADDKAAVNAAIAADLPSAAEGVPVQPPPPAKKSRTNTPWTPAEERKLKTLRDAGSSWSEIAKEFPHRTEGSVKKHWYKDMHYADFAEDESAALLAAIREYEQNKWKEIGKKVGKPAKACEQYAKEHFSGRL